MKKLILILVVLASTGCARWSTSVARDGGIVGSYNGDYVCVNYAGNRIVDVWKLKDTFVTSEHKSDGLVFLDSRQNVIMVGGDVKLMRVKDSALWDAYVEYHYEMDGGDYQDFKLNYLIVNTKLQPKKK